jgi:excisionase family DNA binding protein
MPSPRAYNDPILPTPGLSATARRLLEDHARFQLVDHGTGHARDLPPEVYVALQQVLAALANNQAISIVPTSLELTTNQTADVLNVSRSYVIQLIDNGQLPHRMVGSHRRVALSDALKLRDAMTNRARTGLDNLAKLDQDLGLDD